MSLPKIDLPIININIPSKGEEVSFRTFTVKEEKLLLIAQETREEKAIAVAVKQIINNCCLDKTIDVNKLALVDIEYIFLQLRSFSINNIATMTVIDPEDEKEYIIKIDLSKVTVKYSDEVVSNMIDIDETIKLKLRYPNASIIDKSVNLKTHEETIDFLVMESIEEVYDGDNLTIMDEESIEEKTLFVESIPSKPYELIKAFINSIPTIHYTVTYRNSLGHSKDLVFNSLSDFFTYV